MTVSQRDAGSATVEAVGLLIPVLAGSVLLLVFGFRLALAGQDLTAAAASAARAASLQPNVGSALAAARAETATERGRCADLDVALDATAFTPGGTAIVTITCTLTTSTLTGLGLPGTLTRSVTSRAPIDRYTTNQDGG